MRSYAVLLAAAVVLLLLFGQSGAAESRYSIDGTERPGKRMPRRRLSFCENPPVVDDLNLALYAKGTYYNLYLAGSARELESDCITANYTINAAGKVDVLNCFYTGRGRPQCLPGVGAPRPGAGKGRLIVGFPDETVRPGSYNVAAAIGDARAGYLAAAVYSCTKMSDGSRREGYFILSRFRELPEVVLKLLKLKLECSGYDLSNVNFIPTKQDGCKYFFEEGGFDTISRSRPQ